MVQFDKLYLVCIAGYCIHFSFKSQSLVIFCQILVASDSFRCRLSIKVHNPDIYNILFYVDWQLFYVAPYGTKHASVGVKTRVMLIGNSSLICSHSLFATSHQ